MAARVTLPRDTVLLVQRRLPTGASPGWLTEDVRTAAGLDAGADHRQTRSGQADTRVVESTQPAL